MVELCLPAEIAFQPSLLVPVPSALELALGRGNCLAKGIIGFSSITSLDRKGQGCPAVCVGGYGGL